MFPPLLTPFFFFPFKRIDRCTYCHQKAFLPGSAVFRWHLVVVAIMPHCFTLLHEKDACFLPHSHPHIFVPVPFTPPFFLSSSILPLSHLLTFPPPPPPLYSPFSLSVLFSSSQTTPLFSYPSLLCPSSLMTPLPFLFSHYFNNSHFHPGRQFAVCDTRRRRKQTKTSKTQ